MLEIYPINEQEKLSAAFTESGIDMPNGAAGYIAYDKGEAIGKCLFAVADKQADIIEITPADDRLLCDSLIRAAINYAANRGVFKLYCITEQTKNIAAGFSYLVDDSNEIDITGMMQGCKNCKKV